MRNYLDGIFEEYQFHRITSNNPAITLYIQYRKDYVSVVQLLDFWHNRPVTGEEYSRFKANAIAYIKGQGYPEVNFLTLILTDRLNECKKYVMDDDAVWLIDVDINRLFVYESQVDDFCGLRTPIDDMCVRRGGVSSAHTFDNAYSGNRQNKNFMQREFTVVNSLLVLINVIWFIYLSVNGSTLDIEYMIEKGAMYVPRILEEGEYYRFITCTFLHFGFQHLVGNMVVLLFLGDNVERNIGWFKYLILYLLSGITGSAGSYYYALYSNKGIVSAGASGAIYGVIGALLWLVIRNKGRLEDMTLLRVIVMIAYAIYSGFTSEHIDVAAHLCGFIGGFLLAIILYRKEKTAK